VTPLALAVSGRGVVDPTEPVLRADDEALLRGRAVFETLRVYGGRPFRLTAHLDRLAGSAAAIGLSSVDRGEFEELAQLALDAAGVGDAVLRLVATPGAADSHGSALALVTPVPDHLELLRRRGIRVVTLLGFRAEAPWLLPGVKSTSYAVNMAAEAEAQRRDADDAVFVDGDDVVLEGPVTNVWWRQGDRLFTPSLDLGILAGVTRATVMDLAGGRWEIVEGRFGVDELKGAVEAFTSSSVRELMPIVAVDSVPLPLGPAAVELQESLRRAAAAGD
jgi:4-amino-4-deoxychorismate lyase